METSMQAARVVLVPSLIATLVLSACGGGGSGTVASSAVTPTPSANAAASGTISGLGSIVVNGVRYETIGAKVSDLDDQTGNSAPLRLGMTVTVEQNGVDATTNRPVAGKVQVERGIKGVATLDASGKLSVAGLPITVDSKTFIVGADGVATTSYAGQFVEVYGLPQADGSYLATLIEVKASAEMLSLVGAVSNLNTTAKTFTLGSGGTAISVSYAGLTVPATLANGAVVSVRTSATAASATYTATSLYVRAANASVFKSYASQYGGTSKASNEVNELYGMVSAKKAAASGCALQVQGVPVTLSSTALCASLNDGDYVEAKGVLINGVLAATRIEFKSSAAKPAGYKDDTEDSDNDGLRYRDLNSTSTSISSGTSSNNTTNNQSLAASPFEAYGTLNCAALNTSCTLQIGGVTYPADLSAARWGDGASVLKGLVEVKGYLSAGTFVVSKIEGKSGRG